MSTLRIMRGYPASGKTTLARLWVNEDPDGRARVNRDDLRASMYDKAGVLTFTQEQTISKVQRAQVRVLLRAGVDVVVDDTNLRLKFAQAWVDLAAQCGAQVEVVDVRTDVDECVRRDMSRGLRGGREVGASVIRGIAAKFPVAAWPELMSAMGVAS